MSKKQTIGLILVVLFLILIVSLMRSCRTDSVDPQNPDTPTGEISYASLNAPSRAAPV